MFLNYISQWKLFISRVGEHYEYDIREEIMNVDLNQPEPKLYVWKAQSRIQASAPIQLGQRAESEPEL